MTLSELLDDLHSRGSALRDINVFNERLEIFLSHVATLQRQLRAQTPMPELRRSSLATVIAIGTELQLWAKYANHPELRQEMVEFVNGKTSR